MVQDISGHRAGELWLHNRLTNVYVYNILVSREVDMLLWALFTNRSCSSAMLAEGATLFNAWHSRLRGMEELAQDHKPCFQPREYAEGNMT